MKVTVDQDGMNEFFRSLEAGARVATGAAASVYERAIVRSFGRSGAGGGKKGMVTNIPSAPGSPPNIQTGHLMRSIGYAVKAPMRAAVGTNVAYGRHLEFGAPRANVAARPFLKPISLNRGVADRAKEAFAAEMSRAIRAAKAAATGGVK